MSTKYCENCGAAMPADSKFCTECGTPFPAAKKEEAPAQKPAQTADPEQSSGQVPADPLDALMTRPEETPLPDPQPVGTPSEPAQNAKPVQNQNLSGDPFGQPAKPVGTPVEVSAGGPLGTPVGIPIGTPTGTYGQQPSAQPSQAYARPGSPVPGSPVPGKPGGSPVPGSAGGGQNANAWGRPAQPGVQNQPVSSPAVGYVPGPVPNANRGSAVSAAYGTNPGPGGFGAGAITKESLKGTPFEPIYAWGWVGIFLLLGIPIVNLVLLIVWACGGCRKNAKKSFARGTLLMVLITIVLFLAIGTAVFYALFPVVEPAINEILEQFGLKLVLG